MTDGPWVVNVGAPISDVVPGPRGLVLSALCRLTGGVSGRELARQAGVPATSAAEVLADLVDAGIVRGTPVGRAIAYQLNRDHLVAQAIAKLAGARLDLVDRLKKEIFLWQEQPVSAWLFGSAARGDGDRRSDIDLLLVAPNGLDEEVWASQMGWLAELVEGATGNPCQLVEHTVSSFLALDASRSPLIAALRADGIDLVHGSWAAIARIISGAR